MSCKVRVPSAQQHLQPFSKYTPFLVHPPPLRLHLGCTQDLPSNPASSGDRDEVVPCQGVQQRRRVLWCLPEIVKRLMSRHLPTERQASANAAISRPKCIRVFRIASLA